MIVRMLVYFVIVFLMFRLFGEQRSFVKKNIFFTNSNKASDTSYSLCIFLYALVDFDVVCMIGSFTKIYAMLYPSGIYRHIYYLYIPCSH